MALVLHGVTHSYAMKGLVQMTFRSLENFLSRSMICLWNMLPTSVRQLTVMPVLIFLILILIRIKVESSCLHSTMEFPKPESALIPVSRGELVGIAIPGWHNTSKENQNGVWYDQGHHITSIKEEASLLDQDVYGSC